MTFEKGNIKHNYNYNISAFPSENQSVSHQTDINLVLQAIFQVMYVTITITNLIGNSLVIYVVVRNKSMHKVTNFFILNLSFADILTNICSAAFRFEIMMTIKATSERLQTLCKIGQSLCSLNVI
jgi:hypothetical protein